jgi:hypothetical protein
MTLHSNFDPAKYAEYRKAKQRVVLAYLAVGALLGSLIACFALITLAGFRVWGFALPTPVFISLIGATAGNIGAIATIVFKFFFKD